MSVNNTDPLAVAAQLIAERDRVQKEMDVKMKELNKKIFQASKAAKTPEMKEIKVTEKGQVSFYFNFQKWPLTAGKEALDLLFSDENVAHVRQLLASGKVLSYSERKELGLVAE